MYLIFINSVLTFRLPLVDAIESCCLFNSFAFLNASEYPLLPGYKFIIIVFKLSLKTNFSSKNDVFFKFN